MNAGLWRWRLTCKKAWWEPWLEPWPAVDQPVWSAVRPKHCTHLGLLTLLLRLSFCLCAVLCLVFHCLCQVSFVCCSCVYNYYCCLFFSFAVTAFKMCQSFCLSFYLEYSVCFKKCSFASLQQQNRNGLS